VAPTGTGGTAPPGSTLFSDNFEEKSAPGNWLSGDKQTGLGTWAVMTDGSQVFEGVAAGSDFTTQVSGNTTWTDFTMSADVKVTAGSSYEVALYGRFTTWDSYYIMYMDDSGAVQVRRRLNGSTTTLGTKSKAATAPAIGSLHTFKLAFSGPNITATVDDVVRVTTTDTMLPTGGIGLGISNGTAEFDNVVVTR
jgi:hypothetical protein